MPLDVIMVKSHRPEKGDGASAAHSCIALTIAIVIIP